MEKEMKLENMFFLLKDFFFMNYLRFFFFLVSVLMHASRMIYVRVYRYAKRNGSLKILIILYVISFSTCIISQKLKK